MKSFEWPFLALFEKKKGLQAQHKASWKGYILDSKLGKSLEKYKKNNKGDNLRNGEMESTDNFSTFTSISGAKHCIWTRGKARGLVKDKWTDAFSA